MLAPFTDPLAGDLTNSVPSDSSLPPPEDCWNRIGFKGDRSCGELPKFGHCHNCPVFAAAAERLFARPLPDACVAERGARFERARPSGPTLAVLVFRVGEEWLALDDSVLIEVGEPRVVHRVPHRREQLLRGLVNVRGELQLCVSLAELLGLTPTQAAGDRRRNPAGCWWPSKSKAAGPGGGRSRGRSPRTAGTADRHPRHGRSRQAVVRARRVLGRRPASGPAGCRLACFARCSRQAGELPEERGKGPNDGR